jgi:hypothetical protein
MMRATEGSSMLKKSLVAALLSGTVSLSAAGVAYATTTDEHGGAHSTRSNASGPSAGAAKCSDSHATTGKTAGSKGAAKCSDSVNSTTKPSTTKSTANTAKCSDNSAKPSTTKPGTAKPKCSDNSGNTNKKKSGNSDSRGKSGGLLGF